MRHKNIVLDLNYTKASLQFVPLIHKNCLWIWKYIWNIKGLDRFYPATVFQLQCCDLWYLKAWTKHCHQPTGDRMCGKYMTDRDRMIDIVERLRYRNIQKMLWKINQVLEPICHGYLWRHFWEMLSNEKYQLTILFIPAGRKSTRSSSNYFL